MNKKKLAALKAAEHIKNNMVLGLGTGSTAYYLIERVEELVRSGYDLKCVATSKQTEEHARVLGIPVFELDEVESIDLPIDGVDEIDPSFNAI